MHSAAEPIEVGTELYCSLAQAYCREEGGFNVSRRVFLDVLLDGSRNSCNLYSSTTSQDSQRPQSLLEHCIVHCHIEGVGSFAVSDSKMEFDGCECFAADQL